MREIKFRIWNKTGQRMLYDSSLAFKGNKVIEETGTKVMQFTGLKDKNGKEIYEGDIIEFYHGDSVREPSQLLTGIVVWKDSAFYINFRENAYRILWTASPPERIIGNIYENPDLIIQKKG